MGRTEVQRTEVEGYRFSYYARSGGMVVTRVDTGEVIDAGVIGRAGFIRENRLREVAWRWVFYRREYLRVKTGYRPAE